MAKRKFAKLKNLMFEQELTQDEAARLLGHSKTYICRRLNGHEPFTFDDAQKLGGQLEIPRTEWADYFIEAAT